MLRSLGGRWNRQLGTNCESIQNFVPQKDIGPSTQAGTCLGGLVAFNYLLTYSLTTEKEGLAQEYRVSQDAIVIEPKPHGCAYDDAPLGNKHCHFEKFVDVQRVCR